METVKRGLTVTLIALLCTFLLNVPLVMAETTTVPDVTNQTLTEPGTEPGTEPSTEPSTEPILDENGQPVDPGILPDSPLDWLDDLLGKLQLAFAWTPEQKAEVLEEQALENLAEAAVMIEEGQPEDAEVTLNAYSEKIAAAMEYVALLTDPNNPDNGIEKAKLVEALAARSSSNIQSLGNILDKLPPQAAQRVAVNVVRTMTKSIEKYEKKLQIQLKNDLKKTTEILENADLDEETETALEDLENIDQTEQTDQTDQTSDTNTDVNEDQVDNTTDTNDDPANDQGVDGTVVNSEQEIVTEQDTNPGQANKEQKEEKNNVKDQVFEDGQSDEIQTDDNNGSGKNNGGGKGKKH